MKIFCFLFIAATMLQCADHGLSSGCDTHNSALWADNATISLQVKNSVCNDGSGILFSKVISDSRCPTNANCIWEGEIRIELKVFAGADTLATLELSTKHPETEVVVNQHTYIIELKDVDPYPTTEKQVDPKKYIATLNVYRKIG